MEKQTAGRENLGKLAPKFAELNDDVLFGEVWSREDKMSLRDRSIATISAFYCGWPKAWSAFALIKEVYGEEETKEEHGVVFGQGEPNINFAQYFVGNSYLKPLTNPKETNVFLANVKHWHGATANS